MPGKSPFSNISGSKAIDWNFRSVEFLDELVEQFGGKKKARVEKQNSKKGFERNEHACYVEGVLWVSDWTARPYLKVAGPTRKILS